MNKPFLSFLIIELLIIIYLGLSVLNIRTKYIEIKKTLKYQISSLQTQNYNIKQSQLYERKTEHQKAPFILKDFNDSIIILRLHESICMDCYSEQVSKSIEQIKHNKLNLLIIGSYQYDGGMQNILKDNGLEGFQYINLKEHISFPADSSNSPFFFTINKDGTIYNVFIFQKDEEETFNWYFYSLNKYFLKES